MEGQGAIETLEWVGDVDGHLVLIDQTLLPAELRRIDCRDVPAVWEAIRALRVRGAPAIGLAAAYGVSWGCKGTTRKIAKRSWPASTASATSWPAAGRRP